MEPELFFNMKNLFLLGFVLLLSCGRKEENQTQLNLEYLNKEIANRTLLLKNDSVFKNEIPVIEKEIENLKLLTIDIENINASLIKSNQYFQSAAKQYGVDTAGFVLLYKGIPLHDVVPIIKKNQLNLLNKIIIQRNINDSLMLTAQ